METITNVNPYTLAFASFLEHYTTSINTEFIVPDNFKEDFKTYMETLVKSKTKKPVEICIGKKKNGDPCGFKKTEGEDYCKTHLNAKKKEAEKAIEKAAVKTENPVANPEPKEQKEHIRSISSCSYIFIRGINKGNRCSKTIQKDSDFCSSHAKSQAAKPVKTQLSEEYVLNSDDDNDNGNVKVESEKIDIIESYTAPEDTGRKVIIERFDTFDSEPETEIVGEPGRLRESEEAGGDVTGLFGESDAEEVEKDYV